MFQVAAHPSTFDRHYHTHSSSAPLQLPRTLARPPFAEVSHDAVVAAAPELANVPMEYIRRGLRAQASQMQASISSLDLPNTVSKSQLPKVISTPLRSSSLSNPTHLLAITSSKAPSDQVSLFPIHALVLSANCALLPRLPPSAALASHSLTLPVLPLSLPSPAAFTILHTYLYSRRPDAALNALFPFPPGFLRSLTHESLAAALASGSALHQLSSFLAASASNNLSTLTGHAAHVKELWQDVVALGVYDRELWDVLDLAWEVVIGALNLAVAGK